MIHHNHNQNFLLAPINSTSHPHPHPHQHFVIGEDFLSDIYQRVSPWFSGRDKINPQSLLNVLVCAIFLFFVLYRNVSLLLFF